MKIFISWSGERSYQIALALKSWLPKIFPGLEKDLFVSSEMEKGISWFPRIISELEGSTVGIICLTPESLNSTWLHFEAGALAKSISPPSDLDEAELDMEHSSARLYTYLHQVHSGQLTGPLASYQSTSSVRDDTERLVASLGRHINGESDDPTERHRRFVKFWPELAQALRHVEIPIQELFPEFEGLFQRKTFNEPLNLCTAQTWADRYDGARQTHETLASRSEIVCDACPRYQSDLYQQLLAEVDAYAMNMKALLLKAPPFQLSPNGELDMPPGILKACEDRRRRIKDILSSMLDLLNVPKMDDAVRFAESEGFAQKKVLVHRQKKAIHRHKEQLSKLNKSTRGPAAIKGLVGSTKLREYLDSSWDFDRIFFYLIEEYLQIASEPNLSEAVAFVVMEMETLRSRSGNPSMMPLHYSLGALSALIPDQPVADELARRVEALLGEVVSYIEESPNDADGKEPLERDKGQQVRSVIAEIREKIAQPPKRIPRKPRSKVRPGV